jgi:LacI family transcriptional regulator
VPKAKEMGYFKAKNTEDLKILVLHQKPFVQDTSNYSYMVQGIEKGYTKMGFLGSNIYNNKEKVLGITSALEDYKLPIRDEFFIYAESFEEKVSELISSKNSPTAIICQWDYTAIKLIKFLYEKGRKVPEDISLIGSGNTEMSSLFIPAITTLELNIDYSCEVAVALLLKRISNPDTL